MTVEERKPNRLEKKYHHICSWVQGKEYQTGWRIHSTISAVGHRGKEYLPNKLEET
jgi:hypothetical protein